MKTLSVKLSDHQINAIFARVEAKLHTRGHSMTAEERELADWEAFADQMVKEQSPHQAKPVTVCGQEYPSRRQARKAGAFSQQTRNQ